MKYRGVKVMEVKGAEGPRSPLELTPRVMVHHLVSVSITRSRLT